MDCAGVGNARRARCEQLVTPIFRYLERAYDCVVRPLDFSASKVGGLELWPVVRPEGEVVFLGKRVHQPVREGVEEPLRLGLVTVDQGSLPRFL